MSLLVLGTVAFDAIQTPFGKTDRIVGGAATYISLAASYYFDKVNLVSIIGEDFPEKYIKILKDKNISTEGIEVVKGGKTFFWSGRYGKGFNYRQTISTELNVLENFDPKIPESYKDCECLMLGNLTPTIQKKVIEGFKKRPKIIVMDTMNFWMDSTLDELKETIKLIDVLCINDEEALQLSKASNLTLAASVIMGDYNLKALIVKKGEHGAMLFSKDDMFFVPAFPLEQVFDPTGAGDTFAGGFIGYLAKTQDFSFANMKKALVQASVVASFCVEQFGIANMLEISERSLRKRTEKLRHLVTL